MSYSPGQVLTAAELNASIDALVVADDAAITGGYAEGLTYVQITGTQDSTSTSTGALTVAGGAGIAMNLQVGDSVTVGESVYVNGTTQSNSSTTGALTVAGGAGVGGNVNVGGSVDVTGSVSAAELDATSSTDSTSAVTGAVVVAGGVGIAKALNVGGAANVTGNVGVGGNISVGGSATVTGSATVEGEVTTEGVIIATGGTGIQFADGSVQATAGVVNGELTVNSTGGTVTITTAQSAANSIFKVAGALTSNLSIVFPASPKNFTVQNNTTGSFNVTCTASGQTPSVSVVQGTSGTLFTDATGCYATSAASGIGFSGEYTDSTGLTLSLTQIGGFVQQTVAGIATKLPLAATYPAGKGVVIGNKSTGQTSLAFQGTDTYELPTTLMAGDVYFAASDGSGHWSIGWYTATQTLRTTTVQFADGTQQTTANGTTAPTSTWYTVGTTNTVGSFAAGDTALLTSGFSAPFVDVIRNGLLCTRGQHYTLNADGLHINWIDGFAFTAQDQIEVKTKVIYSPQTTYAPSTNPVTPASGATGITFAHIPGFAFLFCNGNLLTAGVDYTETSAGFTFVGFSANGTEQYNILNLTPITLANMMAKASPVIASGPLTFADGSTQYDAAMGRNRIINGSCRIAQRAASAFATGVTGYGGPDRFYAANMASAGGQFTQSQGSITYNGVVRPSVTQTVNTAVSSTTSGNAWSGICQRIEGFQVYDLLGQQVTLSFLFQTNVSGTYTVSIQDGANTYSYVTTFTAVAGSPQKVTVACPAIPSGATMPQTNAVGMIVWIGALNTGSYAAAPSAAWQTGNYISATGATNWGAAANNYISAAEVQIEFGPVATPFERMNIAAELTLCQRYYQAYSDYFVSGYQSTAGGSVFTDFVYVNTMRAVPTGAISGTPTYSNASGLTFNAITNGKARLQITATAAGVASAYGAPITLSAEL